MKLNKTIFIFISPFIYADTFVNYQPVTQVQQIQHINVISVNANTQNNYNNNYTLAKVVKIRANDTLAVRSGPSVRYLRVGDIPPYATNVKVYRCNSRNWCKVSYGNISGWAYGKYLRF